MSTRQRFAGNRWATQRLRTHGEDGFALLATLCIMLAAFLMVGALLMLTLSTAKNTNQQIVRAQEWRAADGAMDAAINQIVQDEGGRLGSLNMDVCDPVEAMEIDGIGVDVRCTAEASDMPFVQVEDDPGAGQRALRVVGSKYTGDPTNASNTAKSWRQAPASCAESGGCFPWWEAFGTAASPPFTESSPLQIDTDDTTLRHTASEPLQLVGRVAVKEGAAAARNDRTGPGVGNLLDQGPAIAVRGEYAQGDPGLFSPKTGNTVTNSGGAQAPVQERRCGVMTSWPKASEWAANAEIAAVDGLYCADTRANAPAYAAGGGPANREVAQELNPTSSQMPLGTLPPARTAPACPPLSPSTRIIEFDPGSYDAIQTRIVNSYLGPAASCNNRLFHFKPGAYWFDANETTGETMLRNQLSFRDSTSVVIFGTRSAAVASAIAADGTLTPSAAATIEQMPTSTAEPHKNKLCNPDAAGVTITLSGRTSIRHERGRVAICAATLANAPQAGLVVGRAVHQAHSVNLGWEARPAQVTGGIAYRCSNQVVILGVPLCDAFGSVLNWAWNGTFGYFFGWEAPFQPGDAISGLPAGPLVRCPLGGAELLGDCFADTAIALRGWNSGGDTLGAPIDSAQVVVESDSIRADGAGAQTRIDVVPQGASQPLCSVTYPSVNIGYGLAQYELINLPPTARQTGSIPLCNQRDSTGRTLLHDRKQLYDATIGVIVTARRSTEWYEAVHAASIEYGVVIKSVTLRTGMATPALPPVISQASSPSTIDGHHVTEARVTATGVSIEGQCYQPYPFFWDIIWNPERNDGVCADGASAAFDFSNVLDGQTAFNAWNVNDPQANPKLTAFGLSLEGRSSDPFFDILDDGNTMQVQVLRQNGTVLCTASFGKNSFPHESRGTLKYLALLGQTNDAAGTGGGGCNTSATLGGWRASDLLNSRVRLTVSIKQTGWERFQCIANMDGQWWQDILEWFGSSMCPGYKVILDNVKLISVFGNCTTVDASCQTTVANAYEGPTSQMVVTSVNQANRTYTPPGSDLTTLPNTADATFNVYGDVAVPRTDLDVVWGGAYTADPIVSGNLWVNALGSWTRDDPNPGAGDPHVGVLCCYKAKAAERIVRLEAWVDGALRGVAKVRISDTKVQLFGGVAGSVPTSISEDDLGDETWSPGVSVKSEYWQLCVNGRDPNPNDAGSDVCIRP